MILLEGRGGKFSGNETPFGLILFQTNLVR